MRRPQTILSVGAYPELVSLRHAVLRNAGFNVFSTTDPEEAYVRIQPANLGLMLLCYSMPHLRGSGLRDDFEIVAPAGGSFLSPTKTLKHPSSTAI
jgi:CheY-like chemotaxis protein